MGLRGRGAVQPPELTPPWTSTSDSSSPEIQANLPGQQNIPYWFVLAPFPLDPSRKQEFQCCD